MSGESFASSGEEQLRHEITAVLLDESLQIMNREEVRMIGVPRGPATQAIVGNPATDPPELSTAQAAGDSQHAHSVAVREFRPVCQHGSQESEIT